MPIRVDSKKETQRNLSILIALLHEGQLCSSTAGWSHLPDDTHTINVSSITLLYTILS